MYVWVFMLLSGSETKALRLMIFWRVQIWRRPQNSSSHRSRSQRFQTSNPNNSSRTSEAMSSRPSRWRASSALMMFHTSSSTTFNVFDASSDFVSDMVANAAARGDLRKNKETKPKMKDVFSQSTSCACAYARVEYLCETHRSSSSNSCCWRHSHLHHHMYMHTTSGRTCTQQINTFEIARIGCFVVQNFTKRHKGLKSWGLLKKWSKLRRKSAFGKLPPRARNTPCTHYSKLFSAGKNTRPWPGSCVQMEIDNIIAQIDRLCSATGIPRGVHSNSLALLPWIICWVIFTQNISFFWVEWRVWNSFSFFRRGMCGEGGGDLPSPALRARKRQP